MAARMAGVGWVTVSERRSIHSMAAPRLSRQAQTAQRFSQLIRQGRLERLQAITSRQADGQAGGVQKMVLDLQAGFAPSIGGVSGDRAAQKAQVQADLVRAPGKRAHLQQG